jgi:predicted RNA-binding protein with RPS1 domain
LINEDKLLSDLKGLLGKEFTLPELATSYDYDFDEFAQFFFHLDELKKIEFSLTKKGGVRLIHVLGQSANEDEIEIEKYRFPKDINLYRLQVYSLSLNQQLRIEFDKCMSDESFVERFKKMSKDELKSLLKTRADFFKKENEKIQKSLAEDRERLKKLNEGKNITQKSLTPKEKKQIAEAHKKYKNDTHVRKVEKKEDYKKQLELKLKNERSKNKLTYGISETNEERYKRLEEKTKASRDASKQFKERIALRKLNVPNYYLGQIIKGTVTKKTQYGCFVDIGDSDGFIKFKYLDPILYLKFKENLKPGGVLNCEVTDIDLERLNIDLTPTSKKQSPIRDSKRDSKHQNSYKKDLQVFDEPTENHKEKVNLVIQNIIDSGGEDALYFFVKLVKHNIKVNNSEWSLALPKNRKNTIKIYNNALEGGYINDKEVMVVIYKNPANTNYKLNYLVDKYVASKDRQGKYSKLPSAIPLRIDFESLESKKDVILDAYIQFLELAMATGNNIWKSKHEVYLVNMLSKNLAVELKQPIYVQEN